MATRSSYVSEKSDQTDSKESEVKEKDDTKLNPWLHAWQDSLANVKTTTLCLRLGDINCDGDSKLCICDVAEKKLRIFKGTSQIIDYALLDTPVAMCLVYMENSVPKTPSIAVAAASHVFIYRHLRPYKKWTCPPMEISKEEEKIWSDFSNSLTNASTTLRNLEDLRDKVMNVKLTSRTLELLSLGNNNNNTEHKSIESTKLEFIESYKEIPLSNHTLITCMEVLKKDSEENDALNLIVLGTESSYIYILTKDVNNSEFQSKVLLPSIPVSMNIMGTYDTEYRICVSCRDGKIYYIKNGDSRFAIVLSGSVNDLGSLPVSIARLDKSIWVATMDRNLSCYSLRGKKSVSILFNDDITEICPIDLKRSKYTNLMMVAFVTGELKLYNESKFVHSFFVDPPILAMRFGQYGREENCLIVVHGKGTITVEIWRRTSDVEAMKIAHGSGPPPEQDVPLAVPKKTKLFVEQTQRERDNASVMHRTFQRDLCKIRLETARAYVKTLGNAVQMPTSSSAGVGSSDLRLHVYVQGLGPDFVLKVSVQNSGASPVVNAKVMLSYDETLYSSTEQCVSLPAILPGPKYVVDARLKSIDPSGRSGYILVLVYVPQSGLTSSPLLSASVKMPASEILE